MACERLQKPWDIPQSAKLSARKKRALSAAGGGEEAMGEG
jgi:hypothetical protein